jgi:hypothetical protein
MSLDGPAAMLPLSEYGHPDNSVDIMTEGGNDARSMGVWTNGIGEPAVTKLAELVAATGRAQQDLIREGIARLYRIYIGEPSNGKPDEWTGPFSKKHSDRSAEVVVRQVSPATFKLREPFKYIDKGRRFDVPEEDVSDFASVPEFLTWLVPRYGRHTLAALLHDHLQAHLVRTEDDLPNDPERVTSEQADRRRCISAGCPSSGAG